MIKYSNLLKYSKGKKILKLVIQDFFIIVTHTLNHD